MILLLLIEMTLIQMIPGIKLMELLVVVLMGLLTLQLLMKMTLGRMLLPSTAAGNDPGSNDYGTAAAASNYASTGAA